MKSLKIVWDEKEKKMGKERKKMVSILSTLLKQKAREIVLILARDRVW